MCPTCHTTLDMSDSQAARADQELHRAEDRACWTAKQIETALVAQLRAADPRGSVAQGLRPARVVAADRGRARRRARRSPSASGAGAARASPTSRPPRGVRARRGDRAAPRRAAGALRLMGGRLAHLVCRRVRLGRHCRACCRSSRATSLRSRASRPAGSASAARRRRVVVSSLPFIFGFTVVFVVLGAGAAAIGSVLSAEAPHAGRGLRPRRARPRVRRPAARAGARARAGPAHGRAPARVGRAARRRVRRLRRAVHRQRARRGARAREHERHGAEGNRAPRRVRARPRRGVPRRRPRVRARDGSVPLAPRPLHADPGRERPRC